MCPQLLSTDFCAPHPSGGRPTCPPVRWHRMKSLLGISLCLSDTVVMCQNLCSHSRNSCTVLWEGHSHKNPVVLFVAQHIRHTRNLFVHPLRTLTMSSMSIGFITACFRDYLIPAASIQKIPEVGAWFLDTGSGFFKFYGISNITLNIGGVCLHPIIPHSSDWVVMNMLWNKTLCMKCTVRSEYGDPLWVDGVWVWDFALNRCSLALSATQLQSVLTLQPRYYSHVCGISMRRQKRRLFSCFSVFLFTTPFYILLSHTSISILLLQAPPKEKKLSVFLTAKNVLQ